MLKKVILPVLLATVWIAISEFVRNEFFLKSYWVDHYSQMGLEFPSEPVNGIIWGIWSLFLSIAIYIILQRFTLLQSTFLAWFVGFILMWLVIGNMAVLPFGILYFAIPLSFIEVFIAALIIKKSKK